MPVQLTSHVRGVKVSNMFAQATHPEANTNPAHMEVKSIVQKWNSKEVVQWLQGIGLSEVSDAFAECGVDGQALLLLADPVVLDYNFKDLGKLQKIKLAGELRKMMGLGPDPAAVPVNPLPHVEEICLDSAPSVSEVAPAATPKEEVDHLLLVVHGIGNHEEKWKEIVPKLTLNRDSLLPQLKNSSFNMEIVTVDWHQELHTKTDGLVGSLTVKNLDALRSFINRTLLDVFYFMSPTYVPVMYQQVAEQLNKIVKTFKEANPSFKGKISILAHSLGTCLCYDLLSFQESTSIHPGGNIEEWRKYHSKGKGANTALPQQKLHNITFPQLEFDVENFFSAGSPLSMYCTVRGDTQFALRFPHCKNMFNILNPYDPIAYRFEPWIDPDFANVDFQMIKYWKPSSGLMLKLKPASPKAEEPSQILNGKRFDYAIQLGIADPRNWASYSAAILAHRSYWANKDMMLFILEKCAMEP